MILTVVAALALSIILQFALAKRVEASIGGNSAFAAALGAGSFALVLAAGYAAALSGWQTLIIGTAALTFGRLTGCSITAYSAHRIRSVLR